jgi:WD40 repeat protein
MTTRKFKTEESISHLSVSYDGTYLATFHHDANLQATPIFQIWKIKDWDPNNNPTPELCEIPIMPDEPNTLSPIVFSRCNNLASCASIDATFVWEVGNTNTKVIRLITNTVLSVDVFSLFEQSQRARNFGTNFTFRPTVFSPDGGFLATGEFDGSLRLWNLKDNICEQSWQAHSNTITAIAFSPVNT